MFESVSGLFEQKKQSGALIVGEGEARHWAERWLRDKCRSESVYCEQVQGGVVRVRVDVGWLRQEIVLWQSDLLAELRDELAIDCDRIQFVY